MYLFISDIHGNVDNLDALDLSKYKTIFFLGDLYGSFDNDEYVKEFINNNKDKLVCIKGNCDYPYIYDEFGLIGNEYITFKEDDITFYLTHGHRIQNNDANIVIYGHEHIPYIKEENNKTYICVGSVSRPRSDKGTSYLEYENNEFTLKNFNNEVIEKIKISS